MIDETIAVKAPATGRYAVRMAGVDWERIGLGAIGIVLLMVLWEMSARAAWLNPIIISSPSAIAAAFVEQFQTGVILRDLSVSAVEFGVGFGLALLVGIALGFAMGLSRTFEHAVDPFIWFLYSSPTVALYPVLVVWFGFGFSTVVAITFLLTFVSIAVNAMTGVHSVDEQLVRAVRAFGGNRRDIIFKLIFPATVAYIIAGIRIGLGRALTGVTLGEMFGSHAGLGFSITYYAAHLRTADVFVPLTVLVVSGLLLYRISDFIERRLLSWRQT